MAAFPVGELTLSTLIHKGQKPSLLNSHFRAILPGWLL